MIQLAGEDYISNIIIEKDSSIIKILGFLYVSFENLFSFVESIPIVESMSSNEYISTTRLPIRIIRRIIRIKRIFDKFFFY